MQISRTQKVLWLAVVFTMMVYFGLPEKARADCNYQYLPDYESSPTFPLTITTNGTETDNQSKIVTLLRQNPATIFQNMVFSTSNIYDPCVPIFYNYTNATLSFLTDSGMVKGEEFEVFNDSFLPGYYPIKLAYFRVQPFLDISASTQEERIAAEDKIIAHINERRTVTARVGNGSGMNVEVSAPATNCVHISGNGPRKVVFMRGKSWNASAADFLYQTDKVIQEGFAKIPPFDRYLSQFSFYADLRKFYDDLYSTYTLDGKNWFISSNADGVLRNLTSCRSEVGNDVAPVYLFYHALPKVYTAFANGKGNSVIYINLNKSLPGSATARSWQVAIHEVGHAFAGLADEYVKNTYSPYDFFDDPTEAQVRNCTVNPRIEYRAPDNHIYGSDKSTATQGCNYESQFPVLSDGSIGYSIPAYRPSPESMMRDQVLLSQFNVISCGYIMAAIKGKFLTKANAKDWWPQCLDWAVNGVGITAVGVPPVAATPTVSSVKVVPK